MKNKILLWALAAIVCCAAVACSRREQIEVYEIPKQAALSRANPAPMAAPMAAPANRDHSVPQRMLAAIIPFGGQAWFFKAMGPDELLAPQADAFNGLIRSVKFSAEGNPSWTLPEGWKQQPGSGMRFATLQIGSGQPVELTVIPLALPGEDVASYVLSNVNRWRGQLGLGDLTQQDLPAHSVKIELEGVQATLVNMVGKD